MRLRTSIANLQTHERSALLIGSRMFSAVALWPIAIAQRAASTLTTNTAMNPIVTAAARRRVSLFQRTHAPGVRLAQQIALAHNPVSPPAQLLDGYAPTREFLQRLEAARRKQDSSSSAT